MHSRMTMRIVGLSAGLALLSGAAVAGGSIAYTDVKSDGAVTDKLHGEVSEKAGQASVAVADIICTGGRLGRHWAHLGGARIAPFECKIGPMTLEIDARTTFVDEGGAELSDNDDDLHEKAKSIKYSDVAWTWK